MLRFSSNRTCLLCGNFFVATNPIEKHCSFTCRLFYWIDVKGPNECWPWTSGTDPDGYGIIGNKCISRRVHRVAYEFFHGELAPGLRVCHSCDNPPCCNPSHLFAGTNTDNMRDAISKGRKIYHGEFAPTAKLTEAQVRTIRSMSFEIFTYRTVADLLGCSISAVEHAATRRSWKHVP